MATWRDDLTQPAAATAAPSWRDDLTQSIPVSKTAPTNVPTGSTWYDPSTWKASDNPLANTLGTPGTATDAFVRKAIDTATLNQAARVSDAVNGDPGDWRKDTSSAVAQHPYAAGAGALAGALPSGLAGVGKTILGTIGRSALIGGVEGSGNEAESATQALGNVLTGAGLSAAGGGISHGLSNVAIQRIAKETGMSVDDIIKANSNLNSSDARTRDVAWEVMKGLFETLKASGGAYIGAKTGEAVGEATGLDPSITKAIGGAIGGGGTGYAGRKTLMTGVDAVKEIGPMAASRYPNAAANTAGVITSATNPDIVRAMNPAPKTAAESNQWLHDLWKNSGIGSIPPSFVP